MNLIAPTGRYLLTGSTAGLDQSDHPLGCTGEWIDIDEAKTLLGTNDEDLIERLIGEVASIIAGHTGRDLITCTHTDQFDDPYLHEIFLRNWPVTYWHSIRFDGVRATPGMFRLNTQLGIIYKGCNEPYNPNLYCGVMTVNYTAGYDPLPAELQYMFRSMLVDHYNARAGTSGTVGPIKRVTADGMTTEFATAVSYSGVDQQLGVPNLIKPYVGILDKYRSNDRIAVV